MRGIDRSTSRSILLRAASSALPIDDAECRMQTVFEIWREDHLGELY